MAIKEFWIQIENIENQSSTAASKNGGLGTDPDRVPGSETGAVIGLAGVPAVMSRANGLNSANQNGRGPDEWTGYDTLVLRCYKPPKLKDRSDAWEVPEEPEDPPGEVCLDKPAARRLRGAVPGPTIECNIGDRVVIHFRNNDQRNRIVTRMIEIDVPCGGPVKLPIPFSEPFPIEDRIHSLRPLDCCRTRNAASPLPLSDPLQPVGDEARLWQEIGVSTFKTGECVPPGATFVYTWDVAYRSESPTTHPFKTARFVIGRPSSSLRLGCG